MSVRLLRNDYVASFLAIQGVYSCLAHDELFDLGELSRQGAAASPLVEVITMEGDSDSDELDCDGVETRSFNFVAIVIAKSHELNEAGEPIAGVVDPNPLSAGDAAMTIAGRIVNELRNGAQSSYALKGRPSAKMANATTQLFKRQGQAVWIVGWSETAAVADGVTISTVPLETIHTNYEFNRATGTPPELTPDAEDTVDGLTD